MTSRKLRLLAAPPLLLLLVGGAFLSLGSGKAEAFKDNNRSETMEQFLTSVTKDVDAYWTQEFKDSGLPEPRVSYDWIPAGQTASSACGRSGARRRRRRLLPGRRHDLHLRRSSPPRSTTAHSTRRSPAARRATARPSATSRSPTSSPTSTATRSRTSSALFDKYGDSVPTMAFELQADCYAGTWAKQRPRGEPARGRRRPGGARRRARGRRLRHRQPRPPRHARAARGGLEARASTPATRRPARCSPPRPPDHPAGVRRPHPAGQQIPAPWLTNRTSWSSGATTSGSRT